MLVVMAAVLAGFSKLALRPKAQLSCQDLSVYLDFLFPTQSGLLC